METVTLPKLVGHWIENDPLLNEHFICKPTTDTSTIFEIYCDCIRASHSYTIGFRHTNEKRVARIEDYVILICEGPHVVCKFHAAHPMFFQKMRGWIYDMHNRLGLTCDEYLR